MQIYLVGGAVRDRLLGLPVKDKDYVVVGATPEQMIDQGFTPVGKDFPVFLHPETREEYALARTERKTAPGYQGFQFNTDPTVTLEQDLLRRDLTINAIAADAQGNLIDPYHGAIDLQQKCLRHVSHAFTEDPVRILRIARFYARYAHLGFRIADETLQLMRDMVDQGEIDHLVPERVWQEFAKALTEAKPSYFFLALQRCGALNKLFPELASLFNIPNPPQWHPEVCSGIHSLLVLDVACQLSNEPEVRFGALCHDFGKAATPPHQWPGHKGHNEKGIEIISQFCQRLRIPNPYKELACLVSAYHNQIHQTPQLSAAEKVQLLQNCDAYRRPERFQQLLLACEADAKGRPCKEKYPYPQREQLQQALHLTQQISAKPYVAQGLQGMAIKEAIYQARCEILQNAQRNQ